MGDPFMPIGFGELKVFSGNAHPALTKEAAAGQPLGMALLANRGRAIHAAGHIAIDRWQGEERVQMRLIDAALG